MPIVLLSFSTLLAAFWLTLMGGVTREDWISAAYSKVYDNMDAAGKLRAKTRARDEKLARLSGIAALGTKLFSAGNREKEIQRLDEENRLMRGGKLKGLSVMHMPGYVLQRRVKAIGRGGVHKAIMAKCFELYGKKHAENKARQLLAKLLSYPIAGIAAVSALAAVLLGVGASTAGAAIAGIGTILILVLTYTVYDALCDSVKKRRAAISRQFPNVVSKLALLVMSGMIMDRAWNETAHSQETELYMEMRKTAEEMDNLVSPEAAYGAFINRCNTKETTKLASAIMQNMSKGNAEIGRLLKEMARDAWQERRRTAKRDAEKANSKLMIPTMMLFIAVLIMLMVPVAMNFSGI